MCVWKWLQALVTVVRRIGNCSLCFLLAVQGMERGGLCSWCYNLDSISCALLFQQIHSKADVSMVTHEFSGALLLCLPPSALSVIAVNMPPVRHSLLAVSIVCACACVFFCHGMLCRRNCIKGCCAVNVCFLIGRRHSHLTSSKSLEFCFYLLFHHLQQDRSVPAGTIQ